MKEVEIKILDVDPIVVKEKLAALGAPCTHERRPIETWLFDNANSDMRGNNQVLRVRRNGEMIEMGFKGRREDNTDFKIVEEVEYEISDATAATRLLEHLGYTPTLHHTKYRTTYTHGSTLVEIEECPGVPPYLEIEGTEEAIRTTVADLGYIWEDTTNIGGVAVYTHYGLDIHDFQS